MTEENKTELASDIEKGFESEGITTEDIKEVLEEATTPVKPKRKTRRKKAVIEGVTVPEARGYCSECGHAVYDGDTTCRGCGARFNTSTPEELVECPHCGMMIDLEGFRGHFNCPGCGKHCIAED